MRHIYSTIILTLFATVALTAQCIDDSHSPFDNQGWKSCQTSVGPIPERGDRHWLQYDFGDTYKVSELDYWNYNAWGETAIGAREILIDYSTDQQTWTTVGPISLDQAPGSWKYTGVQGVDLGGIVCRYMLVTVVDTYGDGACAGLSELRFQLDEFTSDEELSSSDFSVMPNPATEYITITLPESTQTKNIRIYNTIGQQVQELSYTPADAVQVSVADFAPGLYHVNVLTDSGTATRSFVKAE